jgi:hypothetical protein
LQPGGKVEAPAPGLAPAGEDLDGGVAEMDLDTVAVELDFVEPSGSRFDEIGLSFGLQY